MSNRQTDRTTFEKPKFHSIFYKYIRIGQIEKIDQKQENPSETHQNWQLRLPYLYYFMHANLSLNIFKLFKTEQENAERIISHF